MARPPHAPSRRFLMVALLCVIATAGRPAASGNDFLDFVRAEAAVLRAGSPSELSLDDWNSARVHLRENLLRAWGGFPFEPVPLQPRQHGEFQRRGYRVEKITFQTLPGVSMTANAYVPDLPGRLPAVLVVHGHWPAAKQDPVVQARCIGLARLGFFVLAVDAFGAGERGVGRALGEYHGAMTAATLLPVGLPLSGLQVYENARAVDYLLTRPEVDPARIGITGASGGGNQSMYAAAWDERIQAVVPVCSVGNYQAYLGQACCLCEVVPGALQFTEEKEVLGLIAPRALMIINATKDSVQFSVREAERSLPFVRHIFGLYGKAGHLEHATFQSGHAYSRPMRETMYGWMSRFIKGEGDGSLILEAEMQTEDPETLRCFPGDSRPDDFVTLPGFAADQGRKLLARSEPPPSSREAWRARQTASRIQLARSLSGSARETRPPAALLRDTREAAVRTLVFQPESGITLTARQETSASGARGIAVLLDLDGAEKAAGSELADSLRAAGWSLVTLDLRATGKQAWGKDAVRDTPDHNTAEWSLWLGRPLVGQWVVDLRGLLDMLDRADSGLPPEVALVGVGPAGIAAIYAAALDERVTHVATVGSLVTYVSDVPYVNQRLGVMVPGIVRDVGDLPALAALIAPRTLVVASGVSGNGTLLPSAALHGAFASTRRVYALEHADSSLRITPSSAAADVILKLQ